MELESLNLPSLRSEASSSVPIQPSAAKAQRATSLNEIELSIVNPSEVAAVVDSNETVTTAKELPPATPEPPAVQLASPPMRNPAAISVTNRAAWRPDLFIDLSFLYWHASQQGMDLANSAALVLNNQQTAYISAVTSNSTCLIQDFDYKPGFQLGFGADFYGWSLLGRYTWIRQTTSTNRTAPAPEPSSGAPIWSTNDWFQQLSSTLQALFAAELSSRWQLALDIADLEFGRPYYQGDHLLVAPFMGLRAAWIRQSLRIIAPAPALVFNPLNSVPVSHNHSNSWGIGPRVGLTASCLLPRGWYLDGDLAGSLLFTEYTSVHHHENNAVSTSVPQRISTTLSDYCCLRPELEMGLGFGWGQYFYSRSYHVDFSASYQFAIFWEQNMMRGLMDQAIDGTGASVGDLYLHGLTIRGRFDF